AHREWAEVAQVEVTDPAQGVADDLGLPLALGVQRQVGELSPADAAGAGLGPAAGHAVRGGLVDLDGVAPPEAAALTGVGEPDVHDLTGCAVADEHDAAVDAGD